MPLSKYDCSDELNFVYAIRLMMCQHCIDSDTNIISRHTFLKLSASLQKLKAVVVFQSDTYCLLK